MRNANIILIIVAVVLPLPWLAGCSGSGVPATAVGGVSLHQLAQNHLTSMLLAKSWFGILYPPPGTEPVVAVDPHTETIDANTTRSWGTLSDGSTYDYTSHADSSGFGTETKNGKTTRLTWSAPTSLPQFTQHIVEVFADGTRLAYQFLMDTDHPETPQAWRGSITLADGRALQLELDRTNDWMNNVYGDRLRLQLPDSGPTFDVQVPLRFVANVGLRPTADSQATGTFTTSATEIMGFKATGANGNWSHWEFTASDNTTGQFSLGANFVGGGRLEKGGTVLGVLNWSSDLLGTLSLTSMASQEVTPAAAARDFQIDRWIASLDRLGPAPVF